MPGFYSSSCGLCLRRDVLREQVLPWLGQVTGIELTTQIDITCSKYEFTGEFIPTVWLMGKLLNFNGWCYFAV